MLSVHLDESGTHDGSPVLVIAGLLASPSQWTRLTVAWSKVIAEAGVKSFHATDCATGGGEFKGRPKEARNRLFLRLVNIIVRTASYRVWTAVALEDHRSMPFFRQGVSQAYLLGALGCASCIREIALARSSDYRIPYMFEEGPTGRLSYQSFENLKERAGSTFSIGALSKDNRVNVVPLQAADLFTYEMYRYLGDQMVGKKIPMRGSLQALCAVPDGGGYFLGGKKLHTLTVGMLEQIESGGAVGPIPLDQDRLDKDRGLVVAKKNYRLVGRDVLQETS